MRSVIFLYVFLLVHLSCAQEEESQHKSQSPKEEYDTTVYTNYTDNGCIYYRSHQGDSLMALARHDTTLIILKKETTTETVLCEAERMEIKDIQIYKNKCIIIYIHDFALHYLVMIKSSKWSIVCRGGGYEIPGAGVGVVMMPHEAKNNARLTKSHQLQNPVLKIISENELFVSNKFGKQYYIEIDYETKKTYKVRYFYSDLSNFILLETGMEIAVLSLGPNGRDTVWTNRKKNLDYTIDTIVHKNNILGFVSLNSVWKHSNRKLAYTYWAFQRNGHAWKPILEKHIGLYESYPAEVKEVKHVAYNQVKVTQNNGQKTLIEYNLETQVEKRTVIKE